MIHKLRSSPLSFSGTDGKPLPDKLLQLATWYRTQAERAGSAWIWEARLQKAEDLEAEARQQQIPLPGTAKNRTMMVIRVGSRHAAESVPPHRRPRISC
jgi:hypothetical protein